MSSVPQTAPLVARTVKLENPGELLSVLPAQQVLSWVRRGEGLVGWGETLRIETTGPDAMAQAAASWLSLTEHMAVRDEVGLTGCGPICFGSFAFSPSSTAGGVLIVPEVVVGRRADTWWLTTITAGDALPSPVHVTVADDVQAVQNIDISPGPLSEPDWERLVAQAISRINAAELDKVVLAREVQATAEAPIDPRWVLSRLADEYPGCWTFSVDGLLGATPEMLLRREKGLVTSRVLAGTIRRTGDDERDLALAGSLARSSKDLEEHEYAVRSVQDALAPHCSSMNVPESPFVLHLANVMHLATDVAGVLIDQTSSLALADALHPSAAVCGTPTPIAQELIEQLEGMDRGRYAGPVGWMDADGDGEWGIALRCGQIDPEDPRRVRLFAGCGIVAGSDPAAELVESKAKLLPMINALGGTGH